MDSTIRIGDRGDAVLDPAAARPSVRPARVYICAVCGYGAFLSDERRRCPMCGHRRWQLDRRGEARSEAEQVEALAGSAGWDAR